MTVDGKQYDLWTNAGIEQRFVRWLHREAGPVAAVIGVENGWFVGDRKVMTERVWIARTGRATGSGRWIWRSTSSRWCPCRCKVPAARATAG